jgi:predicted nucleic acid-binding protein
MIIDASVAVKWFIPEVDSDRAIALVGDRRLRAPPLLLTEVGNVIWKKLRRGDLTERFDLLARHAELQELVEIVGGRDAELATRALELSLMLDHAIYDCVYLALAEADEELLVTADAGFRRKLERTPLAPLVVAL